MRRVLPAEDWRPPQEPRWRSWLYDVIFLHDTPAGKAFDVALIAAILVSVATVMLESVQGVREGFGGTLRWAEWVFTILFSIEYLIRLITVRKASKYALSFFGVVDLLAVLPTYLSLLLPGGQYLIVIRVLRVLRVFRVLKLAQYVGEARTLGAALRASRYKITVFLFTVLTVVMVVGSLMYLIERDSGAGFDSIPRSVYWAIVTLTTVGYGNIAPATAVGQTLAAILMIMGYGIIAVPTGIVTVELAHQARMAGTPAGTPSGNPVGTPSEAPPGCPSCGAKEHEKDALFCRRCGARLEDFSSGSPRGE